MSTRATRPRLGAAALSARVRVASAALRRATRRLPAAGWICAAIAFGNGAVWALITPPFQLPDEIAHFSYAQYVGEWNDLPGGEVRGPGIQSDEVSAAAGATRWSVEARPTWFADDMRDFRSHASTLDRRSGSVPPASINNPPLYYLLESIPYRIARSADVFDRLFLMRLLSALLAAVTVACTFLLVRELLPGRPWAWTVGALAVAFQPMFGFMSGGVNNDNLLIALGAVLIYLVARVARRGLTARLAIGLGVVALAGMLTKTSFAGLLPGAAVGALVGIARLPREQRRRALAFAAGGAAALLVPFAVWLWANEAVFDRAADSTTAGFTASQVTSGTNLSGHLSYVWQAFLPRLPSMQSFPTLAGSYPLWDTYVQGFVGRFGWWRYGFPMWVNELALGVYVAILALAAGALVRARAALRRRWPELLTLVLIAGGYAVLVEVAAYRYQHVTATLFEQARYMLPLIPLYGALVAVAACAGGRRWGPPLGALLVVAAITHSLFAMLLVVATYYT